MDTRPYGKVLIPLCCFFFGAAVGIAGAVWWTEKNFRAANEIAILHAVATEGEAAFQQYLVSTPEVGIYALERYITLLQSYRGSNLRILNSAAVTTDLALAYGRLAIVAERLGNRDRASEAYSRALEAFRQAGREVRSVGELKELIQRLDEGTRRARRS